MSIAFACSSCGKKYAVKNAFAGKRARCACGAVNAIPMQSDTVAAAAIAGGETTPPPLPVAMAAGPGAIDFDAVAATEADAETFDVKDDLAALPPPLPAFGPAQPQPQAMAAQPGLRFGSPPRPQASNKYSRYATGDVPKKGIMARIGGGAIGLLFCLGIAAKAYRIYSIASGGSTASSSSSSRFTGSGGTSSRSALAALTPTAAPGDTFPALRPIADSAWPADAAWTTSEPGIRTMALSVNNAVGLPTQLVVHLPQAAAKGSKVPCVFIAPAGTRLFHGITLGDGDTPEQLPYVRAGFAVIAYSIGGPLEEADLADDAAVRTAFTTFRKSQGGFADAEAAIAYALARRSEIDASRLYVAGHSSAATLALLVAAKDDRIKGCCAYAPCTDIESRFGPRAAAMDQALPGFARFEHDIAPINLGTPHCKVLLFHADDDTNVPKSDALKYVAKFGNAVKLVTTPTGGHYESMIDKGIPAGIAFLKGLAGSM